MKKEKLLQSIVSDSAVRRKLAQASHEAFCSIYLSHHITNPYAFFHKEMFRMTEKNDTKLNVVMAFRGSGKSTILNLSNSIWSVLGKPQKKFILVISKTRLQSQSHFENIKSELEDNELLKQDLGPFKASTTEWGAFSIELPLYEAKIMCIGSLQNIRGLKYRNKRPDLIICDDLEDIISVQDKQTREKLYQWFLNEVMSIGNETTNIFVLGNLLHDNSFMVRLKKLIMHNELEGRYHAYPLLDDHNRILWPQKYSIEDIVRLEKSLPKKKDFELYSFFQREYLLNMSYVRDGTIPPVYEISNIATKKEEFSISVPLWAWGTIIFNKHNISDPDGWINSNSKL